MRREDETWYLPDALFDGERVHTGQALLIRDDHVIAHRPRASLPADVPVQQGRGLIAPGYVDLQVNGGGGVLFNATPSPEAIRAIAAAHRSLGTVAILPTVITDAPEILERAAKAVIALAGHPGLLGLHIEGPHIAQARRGTHAARHIRPLDSHSIETAARLRRAGVPVVMTLAPEVVSTDQISELAALGVIVSLGHSDADAETAEAAMKAGAGAVTHLFNAMSQMTARAPGMVGATLASRVPAGLIADGIHVDDRLLAMAFRARPGPDLTFVVSDAMPTVGGPDRFQLYGQDIRLKDGRLINADGALAGAHVTVAQSVSHLHTRCGLDAETVLRAGITVPAKLIGRGDLADVTGRPLSDLIRLAPDTLAFEGPVTV